ncbi:hypothetical protein TNIN_469491 [Trichonephila inaurata madagascariensis]|uniref:Integrase zinc-binding domain-containing protein n=1 Tax=Trichonephila inaurata madagascariensis TaxID=2747483 RepID=A0A8X6XYB5_9ARAC|nr:hypothetical protein TNIN_469491 [Trichonephila inaurata madagascariensis]
MRCRKSLQYLLVGGPTWLKNLASWSDTQDSDSTDALELATEERKPTVTSNISLNDSVSIFFEWTKHVLKFSSIKETFGKNPRLIPPNFIVYLDSDGLLKVETKFFSTDNGNYFRQAILLPNKHELVLRLIEETHPIYNHAGVQTLINVLRGVELMY